MSESCGGMGWIGLVVYLFGWIESLTVVSICYSQTNKQTNPPADGAFVKGKKGKGGKFDDEVDPDELDAKNRRKKGRPGKGRKGGASAAEEERRGPAVVRVFWGGSLRGGGGSVFV